MNVRDKLAAELKPLLPRAWKVIPYTTDPGSITKPVVMLHQQSIERTTEAPYSGTVLVTFSVLILQPKTEPGPADDALDDDVTNLCLALDAIPGIKWTRAERVVFEEKYPAYDLPVSAYAGSSNTEPEGA